MVFEKGTGTVKLPSGQLVGVPVGEAGQELSNVIAREVWKLWEAERDG